MSNILTAEGVTYAYTLDKGLFTLALKGVDIKVKEGEFVALVGHNGSGKSTFAKLINGLSLPKEGNVYIYDMNTADEEKLYDIRRTAGMVFQNPDNQLVATVVDEDVAFGPENIGVPQPEIEERVKMALETVNMTEFAKRAPHMLSGGQKQRVAIAGALALYPKLIVFDEATAMLDPKGRQEVMQTIKKLNKNGMAIIFITHFMEEAALADRIVVMADGVVIKEGAPKDVLSDIETLKKAALLPPFAAKMAHDLKLAGINVSGSIITTEELVDVLCQ